MTHVLLFRASWGKLCTRWIYTASKFLSRKPEGKRPLRIPRSRREDNIKMNLREISM
jgi:hypothetical protein